MPDRNGDAGPYIDALTRVELNGQQSLGSVLSTLPVIHGKEEVMGPKHGGCLQYPPEISEAEVAAFIYQRLHDYGWNVRLEVVAKSIRCRFDVVVFTSTSNLPLRIIEVKKRRKAGKCETQVSLYRGFGVPVDLVKGMKHAKRYVETWKAFPTKPHPHHEPFCPAKHLR